jgi:hypothetical protein
VLKEISKRLPSSSVISFQSFLVEIVCDMPRGASIAFGLAVNPFFASSALMRPARAAPPGWKGFVMVPNCSRIPMGCEAAMPSAIVVFASSRPRRRAHPAAAPSVPVEPVMCQPRS